MVKGNSVKAIRTEGLKDINEKTQALREEKQKPIEAEDKQMYYEMNDKENAKDEEVAPNEDKAFALKASNLFIRNLQEKIIKEKERLQQSHLEATQFIDSIQSALNAMSQSLINHPSIENTEMTPVAGIREEEDAKEEGEDEEEKRRQSSYVHIPSTLIKQNGMYYFEVIVNKRKAIVGPYSSPRPANAAIARFYERAQYLSLPAFQRELKQVQNYLLKRNGYKYIQ